MSILFLASSREVRDRLIARYGAGTVPVAPWNHWASHLLFLLTSRTRLLLAIGDVRALPLGLSKKAYSEGIAVAVIDADPEAITATGQELEGVTARVDWWLPRDHATTQILKAHGVPADRIADPYSDVESQDNGIAAAFEHLNTLMARRPPDRRGLQKLVMAARNHTLGRRVLEMRARRIDTLAELRNELKQPETILCLGNGPSSEDPALDQIKFDCLFRVNHRWLERGRLCQPDVVFTGQKRTLFTLRNTVFAFQTRRAEAHLLTHQTFNPLCRRMHYVTLERIGILPDLDWDGVRPTNGATMLTAAVALRPKRLIVAGVDLFEDPAGAYPGDSTTPNEYVLIHRRPMELRFILEILQSYEGELVIVGQALSQKWAAYRETGALAPDSTTAFEAHPN